MHDDHDDDVVHEPTLLERWGIFAGPGPRVAWVGVGPNGNEHGLRGYLGPGGLTGKVAFHLAPEPDRNHRFRWLFELTVFPFRIRLHRNSPGIRMMKPL